MSPEIQELFEGVQIEVLKAIKTIDPIHQDIYASGFWFFYCDYEAIYAPSFGYNSFFDDEDCQWSPPNWEVDINDEIYEALNPIYEKISEALKGKSDEIWEEVIEYNFSLFVGICKNLNTNITDTESPFSHWSKTSDFVVGIFEERESEELYTKLVIQSVGQQKAKDLQII